MCQKFMTVRSYRQNYWNKKGDVFIGSQCTGMLIHSNINQNTSFQCQNTALGVQLLCELRQKINNASL